ncbi:hypothetical protein U1Q18_045408, partial [Sarracenia purpurea var. burkii]
GCGRWDDRNANFHGARRGVGVGKKQSSRSCVGEPHVPATMALTSSNHIDLQPIERWCRKIRRISVDRLETVLKKIVGSRIAGKCSQSKTNEYER